MQRGLILDKGEFNRMAAIFSSSYIKRWLESNYDSFYDIPAVAKLRALDPTTKFVIEANGTSISRNL